MKRRARFTLGRRASARTALPAERHLLTALRAAADRRTAPTGAHADAALGEVEPKAGEDRLRLTKAEAHRSRLLAGDPVFVPVESLVPRHRGPVDLVAASEIRHRVVPGRPVASADLAYAVRIPLVEVGAVLIERRCAGTHCRCVYARNGCRDERWSRRQRRQPPRRPSYSSLTPQLETRLFAAWPLPHLARQEPAGSSSVNRRARFHFARP